MMYELRVGQMTGCRELDEKLVDDAFAGYRRDEFCREIQRRLGLKRTPKYHEIRCSGLVQKSLF